MQEDGDAKMERGREGRDVKRARDDFRMGKSQQIKIKSNRIFSGEDEGEVRQTECTPRRCPHACSAGGRRVKSTQCPGKQYISGVNYVTEVS